MPRPRSPGLQVPQKLERELRFFLEAVKERLEVLGGERAAPMDRAVTIADLKATGLVKVATKGNYAELTGPGSAAGGSTSSTTTTSTQTIDNALSLFEVKADAIDDDHIVILWDRASGSYRRIDWPDFASLFADDEVSYPQQLRHAGIV